MEDLSSLVKSYIKSVGHLIQVINVQHATKDLRWLMLANTLHREKLVKAVKFASKMGNLIFYILSVRKVL